MSSIMQNNWFCKSKEQFTRIACGIHADFSKVCPPAASWKLGPCQMHLFFSKLVSTFHKIPQTSLLIMYNSSFTRTFHPGK
jgi:hypothetical protein